jgi:hypothetical protein
VLDRCITDAGYLGSQRPARSQVQGLHYRSEARRLTEQIKREFKRRAAIEPAIGHLKEQHRMGRNNLAHASGDAINAVLAAAGYNFRRLLRWLRLLLPRILIALGVVARLKFGLKPSSSRTTTTGRRRHSRSVSEKPMVLWAPAAVSLPS